MPDDSKTTIEIPHWEKPAAERLSGDMKSNREFVLEGLNTPDFRAACGWHQMNEGAAELIFAAFDSIESGWRDRLPERSRKFLDEIDAGLALKVYEFVDAVRHLEADIDALDAEEATK